MLVSWTIPSNLLTSGSRKTYKKERTETTTTTKSKCYTNAEWQTPVPRGSKLHMPPTSIISWLLNKSQTKKSLACNNNKKLRIFCWKKVRRMHHKQKNDKTGRARGLGRKTRQESREHSCPPLLGVKLRPEFVNLHFPYAGRGLLFFRWQQRHFEFQPAHVAVEGRSNVVLNTHARLQISLLTWFLSLLQ